MDRANAIDARIAKHTHRYNYNGVNFTTKWFVTSGRPIVNDEKTDYATVITGTPIYVGETTAPVAAKQDAGHLRPAKDADVRPLDPLCLCSRHTRRLGRLERVAGSAVDRRGGFHLVAVANP